LSVEFYIGFFDLLQEDLLKVVQESKRRKVMGVLNFMFLVVIPKKKEYISFEDF
jgi:hypothetical protein